MIDRARLYEQPAFTRPDDPAAVPVTLRPADSELPRPHLDYDVRRRVWLVVADYRIHDEGCVLTIPAGFTLDLASIPRALWVVLSSIDLGLVGPLAHDFLYWREGATERDTWPPRRYTRHEADRLFCRLMKLEGVPVWKRSVAYRAVRVFGVTSWGGRQNGRERNERMAGGGMGAGVSDRAPRDD